eukprot:6291395-Pyramimonas_sp.AAC.1
MQNEVSGRQGLLLLLLQSKCPIFGRRWEVSGRVITASRCAVGFSRGITRVAPRSISFRLTSCSSWSTIVLD